MLNSQHADSYSAARLHLLTMPAIVHAHELDEAMRARLLSMQMTNLLQPLMPRAGVYRNLASNRPLRHIDFARALAIQTPSITLSGESALSEHSVIKHAAGAATQLAVINAPREIALDEPHPSVQIGLHTPRWRQILLNIGGIQHCETPSGRATSLTPGAALAELLFVSPERAPDPDLIDFKAMEDNDLHRLRRLTGLLHASDIKSAYATMRSRALHQKMRAEIEREHAKAAPQQQPQKKAPRP